MPVESHPLRPEQVETVAEGRHLLLRSFLPGVRIAAPHTPLIREGEQLTYLFRLHSGWAIRRRILQDGRRAILTVYVPGDFIGLEGLLAARAQDDVITTTDAACQFLPLTDAITLAHEQPAVTWYFLQLSACERQQSDSLAVDLGRCSATERMAAFLLSLNERLRANGIVSGNSFRLPLTQQEIGDHLGTTVVHTNRVLQSLRRDGVALVNNQVVVISDLKRLSQIAGRGGRLPTEMPSSTSGADEGDLLHTS